MKELIIIQSELEAPKNHTTRESKESIRKRQSTVPEPWRGIKKFIN